jgi:hypothetical protein
MSDLKAAKDGRSVVAEHLTAFNEHDTDRLLAGFASDAVWATGQLVVRGRASWNSSAKSYGSWGRR